MNYSQFVNKVKESLQEKLGAQAKVETINVPKNNGIMLQGITIRKPRERVVPTIYMERFYADYLEGRDMEDILEDFLEIYEEQEETENLDFEFYRDYAQVKTKLAVKLVGRKKNGRMLSEMPHRDFLDMAVIYYCLMDGMKAGTAAILVKYEHMEKWGISERELYEDALKNSEAMLPGRVKTMEELLSKMVLEDDIPAWEWKEKEADGFPMLDGFAEKARRSSHIPMLILTNERRYLGASCILYRGLLKQVADRLGKNFFILPSSIHEVILLPEDRVHNADKLIQMVAEVNRTQVEPEEVLSDTVYYYDRKAEKIAIYDVK